MIVVNRWLRVWNIVCSVIVRNSLHRVVNLLNREFSHDLEVSVDPVICFGESETKQAVHSTSKHREQTTR